METTNIRNVPAGEICDIKTVDGLIIEMFRSGKYTGPRDGLTGFRPAKIVKNDTTVWAFQTAGIEAGRFAELVEYGEDEHILTIQNSQTVFGIMRVRDFAHAVPARLAGKTVLVGGSSVEELLDIKIAVSNALELEYWFSEDEAVILRKRTDAARAAAKAKSAEEDAANSAKRLERARFVESIASRKTVEAWSVEGKHYFGIPVTTPDEWMCLPHGKYIMMMENDVPVEAFIVDKKGSKIKKANPTAVSANKPKAKETQADMPEASDQKAVTLRGETRTVLIFDDVSAVKKLQASGLNSGTWVGVRAKASDTLTVYAVTKNGYNAVGELKKKTAQAQA
jgi:hypothetical protein